MKILEKLSFSEGRVFDIERCEDGRFEITEACDLYFSVKLSSAELTKLGEEIIALAKDEG